MVEKKFGDSQTATDYLKHAHAKSIEVVTNAIASAHAQADEMSPSDMFASGCTLIAVLIASY